MRKWIVVGLVAAVCAISVVTADDFYTKYKDDERKFGEPTDDMALVYVVRPATVGAAIRTWAFYGDELIGVMRGKGYSFALVPPGKHLFWAKAENTSGLDVEVEAGKTYYLKLKILPGLAKARVKLTQMDEAEAEKAMKKCGYCVASDAGRQRAAEIAANRMEKAEKKAAKRAEKD